MPSYLELAFVAMRDGGQCVLCPDCLSILSLAGWLSMSVSSPRQVFVECLPGLHWSKTFQHLGCDYNMKITFLDLIPCSINQTETIAYPDH